MNNRIKKDKPKLINKNNYISFIIVLAVVLTLVIIDQVVKIILVKNLEPNVDVSIWKEYIQFTLCFNKGIAFGKFQVENTIILGLFSLIIASGIGYLILKFLDFKKKPFLSVALTLMLAGALGNMIDRIFNFPACLIGEEGVVDFVNTDFIPNINWGIWNIADALLCIGTVVMMVHILFFYKESPIKKNKNEDSTEQEESNLVETEVNPSEQEDNNHNGEKND